MLAEALGPVDRGPLATPDPSLAQHAETALAALRRAATDDNTPRGLLATAEVRWRVGDISGADELLRECEDRVARGPMPLFHAELSLLRARMALSAGSKAKAEAFRDQAADLIDKHGYGGARPELAVLSAEIEPTEQNIADAARAIRGDALIPQDEANGFGDGWWGLMPRFRALVEHRPEFASTLSQLEAACDAYNAARDAWLERTGGIPKPGERPSAPRAPGAGRVEISPDQITDDMVAAALGDPQIRELIAGLIKQTGYEGPLEDARPGMLKAAVAAIAEHMQRSDASPPQREISDELVEAIFADPDADETLREMMRRGGLEGAPGDLPLDVKRAIVAKMVEEGIINLDGPDDAAS